MNYDQAAKTLTISTQLILLTTQYFFFRTLKTTTDLKYVVPIHDRRRERFKLLLSYYVQKYQCMYRTYLSFDRRKIPV